MDAARGDGRGAWMASSLEGRSGEAPLRTGQRGSGAELAC